MDVFSTGWVSEMAFGFIMSVPITAHGLYFPSIPFPSPSSLLVTEKDMVDDVKQDVWKETESC